jgi:multiple sugar transport system permease protein
VLERESNFRAWLYLAPALILLSVFTFYPLFNSFYLAFLVKYNYLTKEFVDYTLIGNFEKVLTDKMFWQAMKNTFVIVFVSVPISVLVALFISVALNSIKKLQGAFQTIFFLPYVTNAIAVGMAFAFLFNTDYGLINQFLGWFGIDPLAFVDSNATWGTAMAALLVYTVWGGLAFKIMVFLSGLQSIDKQYYDAAKIDATPRSRVFRRITVPLLSPMIAYITITSFIGAFKAYRTVVGMFGVDMIPPGHLGSETSLITIVGYIYRTLYNLSPGAVSIAAATAIILFVMTLFFTMIQMWVSKKRVHF